MQLAAQIQEKLLVPAKVNIEIDRIDVLKEAIVR
jgi:hypothetical protein